MAIMGPLADGGASEWARNCDVVGGLSDFLSDHNVENFDKIGCVSRVSGHARVSHVVIYVLL